MTRIKISGVRSTEEAQHAASLGVDYVSCIFSARSPRYATTEQAIEVREALPSTVSFVGVFVDTPTPLVQRVADFCRLDYVQLFGAEPRGVVDAVRTRAFKAITVGDRHAAEAAVRAFGRRWSNRPGDPSLLLHYPESSGEPWSDLPPGAARESVVLAAAALTVDNTEAMIREARPWAVDVWDAIEEEPGKIDLDKLTRFVSAVRSVGDVEPTDEPSDD